MAGRGHQPKAIIFDCWNTLFYVHSAQGWMRRLSRTLQHGRNYRFLKTAERSLMTTPQPLSVAARQLARAFYLPPVPRLLRRIEGVIANPGTNHKPYKESLAILSELKTEGYRLAMITNTYEQAFSPVRLEYRLDELFETITPSYEVGLLKPDPRIFELTLKKLNLKPGEVWMVGDSLPDDILAAEAIGIKAIHINRTPSPSRHPGVIKDLGELSSLLAEEH